MASRRQQILAAIATRLEGITTASGFHTNAGQNVILGQAVQLGEDDQDAVIAVVVGDQEFNDRQRTKVAARTPYEIQAIVRVSPQNTEWITVEQMIEDIRNAIETDDPTLGGLVNNGDEGLRLVGIRALPRDPGMTDVGAGVIYMADTVECWGAP